LQRGQCGEFYSDLSADMYFKLRGLDSRQRDKKGRLLAGDEGHLYRVQGEYGGRERLGYNHRGVRLFEGLIPKGQKNKKKKKKDCRRRDHSGERTWFLNS